MKKFLLIPAFCLSLLLITACPATTPTVATVPAGPDATLTKVSVVLLDIAKENGSVENALIQANKTNLLSDANFSKAAAICAKIDTFIAQASKITRNQVNTPVASRSAISGLLIPSIMSFQTDLNNNLVGITDANTKTTINAAILAVQTGLTTIQIAVGGN